MPVNDCSPQTLCRDCGKVNVARERCNNCGGRRIISHPELLHLGIAHLDCDAFFAAIEKRDNPDLADKPVLVGGGQRGVVATCCYIARGYGVRSAMPMFKALALCPDAVVVRPSFDKYVVAAKAIRAAMEDLTPLVQPLSIDEAFMDLTGTERLHGGPPAATLARLARRIEKDVGITVSIGLSHNKLLAKIASDLDKPRGFAVIGAAETEAFLAPYPVGLLPGVGPAFSKKLQAAGYRTLGDVQASDPKLLARRFGDHGLSLYNRAHGRDHRPVRVERETKSVSGETTFHEDIRDRLALEDRLYAMAQKVSERAKAKDLAGRVVTLKLKTSKFKSLTRRQTLSGPTNLARVIFEAGRQLLVQEIPHDPSPTAYRLIGIGISDLVPAAFMDEGELFADDHKRIGRQEGAIARLRARFGPETIGTARDQRVRRKP
ncbi:DNA polymerase IV [Parvularcula sp. LCG005]|uniref:DNA polymerase IV n=1 Tax=Parvularcula sp. LCG005 TaxID=3078805 RepID=UPI0029432AB4|nr:DNA polymerase IV [Parvularcula sp. LCG005]WOI52749.1 DNA polymerase IV [Parvularcula sp. LCG005]